ncbi:hypothetical protein Y900_029950 [Mycolicibacterium aromaticivorans JS19b1 = JCM 16368]|uniref:Uncharacterized protein n=1 Tax=Mycolicibacterium aromaticivorans JS19b1 = JCM 16368 TaxID=1440774 RepID=A0A064C8C1_9MYCO|nr:hypothetical protein [Mycolicibacterium aromaticivorans]KDE96859.1 hypothetical protein Y900_029950 [Mycolicibacterium aromaticivorans JS19b1 = JCM 16368]
MAAIHNDVPELGSTTGGWFSAAPTQPSVHPICTPGTDPLSVALSATVADWPAAHEALTAKRVTDVTGVATANGGTAAIMTGSDETNAAQISGIEV